MNNAASGMPTIKMRTMSVSPQGHSAYDGWSSAETLSTCHVDVGLTQDAIDVRGGMSAVGDAEPIRRPIGRGDSHSCWSG
jgi:hypothetical protein